MHLRLHPGPGADGQGHGNRRDQRSPPSNGARDRRPRLPEEILVQRLEAEHAGDQDATKILGVVVAALAALPVLRGLRRHVALSPPGQVQCPGAGPAAQLPGSLRFR